MHAGRIHLVFSLLFVFIVKLNDVVVGRFTGMQAMVEVGQDECSFRVACKQETLNGNFTFGKLHTHRSGVAPSQLLSASCAGT